jgi:hypothetical protein
LATYLAIASGAEKTEHYEIVAYTGLVQMAKISGKRKQRSSSRRISIRRKRWPNGSRRSQELGKQAKAAQRELAGSAARAR